MIFVETFSLFCYLQHMRELHCENVDLKAELQVFQNETSSQLRIMNLNVQRILTAPSVRMSRRGETESQNEEDMRGVETIPLIRCP